MDTVTEKNNISRTDPLDEVFASLPEGVEDFIWSDTYDKMLVAVAKTVGLTPDQTTLVHTKGQEIIATLKTQEQVARELIDNGLSTEIVAKTLYLIDQAILQPLANIVSTTPFIENVAKVPSQKSTPPSTSNNNVLASLKDRLTTPSAIAPSVQSVRASAATTEVKKETPSEKSSIDPYREIPS